MNEIQISPWILLMQKCVYKILHVTREFIDLSNVLQWSDRSWALFQIRHAICKSTKTYLIYIFPILTSILLYMKLVPKVISILKVVLKILLPYILPLVKLRWTRKINGIINQSGHWIIQFLMKQYKNTKYFN